MPTHAGALPAWAGAGAAALRGGRRGQGRGQIRLLCIRARRARLARAGAGVLANARGQHGAMVPEAAATAGCGHFRFAGVAS